MIATKNFAKDACRLFFWYPFRWSVQSLPFPLLYLLGGVLGHVDYLVSGQKRRQRMYRNVTGVFGPEKGKTIVKQNLKNHVRNMLEFMAYARLTKQNVAKIGSYEGEDILTAALEKGKGVILLTAHFGAKQFLQVALALDGYRLNQVYHHMSSEELSFVQKRVSQQQRKNIEKRIPINFIPAKSFGRPLFDCLKRNEILIIAGDGLGLKRYVDKTYQPFAFFGKKMLFPTNPIVLAQKTGAVIVPVFVIREKAKHRIVFQGPLDPRTPQAIETYTHLLEQQIRANPHLWEFWEEFDEENLLVSSRADC